MKPFGKVLDFANNTYLRFAVSGLLNTLFGFMVYSLIALTPLKTWLVLFLSNLVGILFNFLTSGFIVFRNAKPSILPKFIAAYISIYFLYLIFINALTPFLGSRIYAMGAIVVPMAILSYVIQSRFVFR